MEKNKPYRLIRVKSKVDRNSEVWPLGSIDELLNFIGSNFTAHGYCVAYLDYQVLIGRYVIDNGKKKTDGKILFYHNQQVEPRFLQRLRVFNQERELFIWRGYDGFNWRLRIDGDAGDGKKNEKVDVVEVEQVLWGTRAKSCGQGWSKIYEDRGAKIILPGENLKVDTVNRVKLITRNYIHYNNLGQAGYVDCRFVKFTLGGKVF